MIYGEVLVSVLVVLPAVIDSICLSLLWFTANASRLIANKKTLIDLSEPVM